MFFPLYRYGFTVLNQVGRGIVRDLVIFGADADARASVFIYMFSWYCLLCWTALFLLNKFLANKIFGQGIRFLGILNTKNQ
jgi:hypothetical protein